MTFVIESIGTAVPANALSLNEAIRLARRCCLAPLHPEMAPKNLVPAMAETAPTSAASNGTDFPHLSARCEKPLLMNERNVHPRAIDRLFAMSGIRQRFVTVPQSPANSTGSPFYFDRKDAGDFGPTTAERMTRYTREAPALAVEAAERAVKSAGISRDSITHLITISCTGFHAPGVDIQLIKQLGLNLDVSRTHIGYMGCHAAINGLRIAQSLAESSPPESRILMCAVELSSLHLQYRTTRDALVANAIFADGAAALVGRNARNDDHAETPHDRNANWRLCSTASHLIPDTEDLMQWRIGDHGFEMTLSPRVPLIIKTHLRPWLETFLTKQNLEIDDIRSWAIHPGGPRVLDAVQSATALPHSALDTSRNTLADHGNMSSATVLFILIELTKRRNAAGPCVMLAFGPGLAIEAALLHHHP